ncbi:hypothetical protein HanRHA438_Chr10g0466281 [Helianthus annuus]|nr:hypothetical protein HanRHA438_Chr10g0466281 [Helianthus annuus]
MPYPLSHSTTTTQPPAPTYHHLQIHFHGSSLLPPPMHSPLQNSPTSNMKIPFQIPKI